MTENSHICRLLDANTITDDNGERHLADGWETLFDTSFDISVKHDKNNPDICIFKYKPAADFSKPIVREARGIIIDVKKCEVLCWPFDKFGNWFEPYAARIDMSMATAQEKIDGCFSRHDCVMLADGSKMPIGKIVNQKLECDVLSYNFATGKVEPKRVVGWKKSSEPFNDDEWLTFHLRGVKQSLGAKKQSQHSILTLTKNHRVFVMRNENVVEICAGDCVAGDVMLTPSYGLSDIEYQVIIGGLLGDGSLTYVNDDTVYSGYRFTHSCKQKEYALYKAGLLESIGVNTKEKHNVTDSFGKSKITVQTNGMQAISQIKNMCYDENGKKCISEKWLSSLDWLGFAIWYMDDGSLNTGCKNNSIHLHTEGFSKSEVECISTYYNSHGLKNYIQHYREYYMINFSTFASEEIWKNIRGYIPEAMQYKLPKRHRGFFNGSFIENNDERGIELFRCEIKEIERGLRREMGVGGSKKYDIEVEDNHNYFCGGVLVHNSLVKLWWYDGEWHWSTMNTIDARDAKVPHTGKTFYDLIQDALLRTDFNLDNFIGSASTHMFELVSPYTQVVVRHEETKLYYLGSRDISSGKESVYRQLKRVFDMPESYPVSDMADIIEKAEQLDGREHEGFVVVDANFNRVKVKSPEYVRIHHTMNNGFLRKEDAVRIIREFDTEAIEAIKSREELCKAMRFYALETHWAGIKLVGLVTEARAFFAERYNYDRKKFATEYAAQFQPPWKAIAFMAIDTDIDPLWFPDALDIKTLCKLVPDYQA